MQKLDKKKIVRKWEFSSQICVVRGAAVIVLNGSFHSKETLRKTGKIDRMIDSGTEMMG